MFENPSWQKQLRHLLFASCLTYAASSAFAVADGKATFRGRPASYWLERLQSKEVAARREAVEALAAIGPDASDGVSPLLQALKDEDGMVREGAVKALGKIGSAAKAAVGPLAEAPEDKDPRFRSAALTALAEIGVVDDRVLSVLANAVLSSPRGRKDVAAINALESLGPKARGAVPTLKKGLDKSRLPADRATVVQILGKLGPDAIPLLKESYASEDPMVQAAIIKAMGEVGDAKEAVPFLKERLDEKMAVLAVDALANYPEGIPVVAGALKHSSRFVVDRAAHMLWAKGKDAKAAAPALIEALSANPPQNTRNMMQNALKAIGPDAVPVLVAELRQKKGGNRVLLIQVLGDLGPAAKEAVPTLIELLKDKNNARGAVDALQRIGEPALAPLAVAAGENEEAARALLQWKQRPDLAGARDMTAAVPELVKHLKSEDPETRARACRILARIGPEARSAVPALQDSQKDKIPAVRDAATVALASIHGKK